MIRKILSIPVALLNFLKNSPKNLKEFFYGWVWQILTFSILLLAYLGNGLLNVLTNHRFCPTFIRKIAVFFITVNLRIVQVLNGNREKTINRIGLIDLAIRNMMLKKSRAFVTVGGMAVGIGAIVYLVSLGYGINKLVIDRVARLDEMMQADATPQTASQIKINDEAIAKFKDLPNVKEVLPMIAVVAKVEYQNSVTDMAVYGVTSDYLQKSAIQPTVGELYTNNEIATRLEEISNEGIGQVAGVSTETESPLATQTVRIGEKIQDVEIQIYPDHWLRVRSAPEASAPLLGYTKRDGSSQMTTEVWGGTYLSQQDAGKARQVNDVWYGKWIEGSFLLWEEQDCSLAPPEEVCEAYVEKRDLLGAQQEIAEGYLAQLNMTVLPLAEKPVGTVLGITSEQNESSAIWMNSTEGEVLAASDEAFIEDGEWVEIASESALLAGPTKKTIDISKRASKQAVVNQAMLRVLGISTDQAVGTTFSTSFQVVGNLLDSDEQLESVPAEYTIIGVVPEDSVPFFYVPFMDLRSLGITNYSQAKIISADKESLADVRRMIESMGFTTSSVADTVEQIDRLFATLRSVLALLGMVALSVAALGMFNTLTVSLLERTREVGLMKAMGMKSHEVRELFLTESMIMGFFGGILGISIGFLAGKATGLVLSAFALSKGQGFLDVSYIPPSFIMVVFGLSLLVGIFTGVYPAKRATKISALDALRYE